MRHSLLGLQYQLMEGDMQCAQDNLWSRDKNKLRRILNIISLKNLENFYEIIRGGVRFSQGERFKASRFTK